MNEPLTEKAVSILGWRNHRESSKARVMRRWKSYQEKTDKATQDSAGSTSEFLIQLFFFSIGPTRSISATSGDMFKKTKSKVLVDYASEEDDMSWHYHHSYKVMTRIKSKQRHSLLIMVRLYSDELGKL